MFPSAPTAPGTKALPSPIPKLSTLLCYSCVVTNLFIYVPQVFPLQDEWYVTYRNYEEDPAFGSGKCLKAKQESPETEDGYPIVLSYKGSEPK